jgi:SsrA-binding protein
MTDRKTAAATLAQNRRARHDYHLLDTVEAGLVLTGTEVKSVRRGQVQLKDSHVEIRDGQAWLLNAHISPYEHGNLANHEPERPRKLLLHRREIDRLFGRVRSKGLTIVPLRIFTEGPWIKVEIALAQGKKLHDKRESERIKQLDQEMRQARDRSRW